PVEPLQPDSLHPARGTASPAGQEVDGAATWQEYPRSRCGAVPIDPLLLARLAEADDQDVGVRGPDLRNQGAGTCLDVAWVGCPHPGDRQRRIALMYMLGQEVLSFGA